MKVFNIKSIEAFPYEERAKNVFFSSDNFKLRIIELKPDGRMPSCEMESNVIFYMIKGEAEITVNGESKSVKEGECLISAPGTFSMHAKSAVRMLGIQIF
jgi:quercetin dioxygenase-like cupin family protein